LCCREWFSRNSGMIFASTLLVPRELLLAVPFQSGLRKHQDLDWVLRAAHAPGVVNIMMPEPLTVLTVEESQPPVDRPLDWESSLEWANRMRPLLSRRAYSNFVVTYCVRSVEASGSGSAGYRKLLRKLVIDGRPSFGLLARMLVYLTVSTGTRGKRINRITELPGQVLQG
jgi:hypothetical protein